jgi:MFS family permease
MTQNLDIGGVLERVFRYYRDQAGLLLPAALILFLVPAIINGAIRAGSPNLLLILVSIAVGIVATYWFQGMVVEAVRDMQDGRRDFDLGGLFRSAMPVIAPLVGAGILAGFGIAIGFILLIVPGLILLTIWAVVAPAIVVERKGVFEAFGRSRELVRGNGWQVFGVLVILFIIQFVAGLILGAIAGGIADNVVGYSVGQLLSSVLVAPLSALAAATLYFELRRLKGEPAVGAGREPGQVAAPPAPPPGTPPPAPPAAETPTQQQPPGSQPPPTAG